MIFGHNAAFVFNPTTFHPRSEPIDSSCSCSVKDTGPSEDVGVDKAKSATVGLLVATPLPDTPYHGVAVRPGVGMGATTCKTQRGDASNEGQIKLGASTSPGSDTLNRSSSSAFLPLSRSLPNHDCAETSPNCLSDCTKDTLESYSFKGLSPLQTVIPDELMPDELIVHDFRDLTHRHPGSRIKSQPLVRYHRAVFPTGDPEGYQLVPPTGEATKAPSQHQVAHLYLSRKYLGHGSHSAVFRAPLELRLDPTSGERTRVTVAVKTASVDCDSHRMLHHEGKLYNAFPRGLMEESLEENSGVDADEATANALLQDCQGGSDCSRKTLPAVVPKFYGYYLPLDSEGNLEWELHPDKAHHIPCKAKWRTALLLVEECGEPINPYRCTDSHYQRNKCLELFERLHEAGFSQGSPYMRNILVQTGPLSKSRELRSMDAPSFRLIDFGRGTRKEDMDGLEFAKTVELETEYARRVVSECTLRASY